MLCGTFVNTLFPFLISPVKYKSNKDKSNMLNRDEKGETVKSDLAEARGARRELSDLYRLIIIGVIFVIVIDVMITIWAGWRRKGDRAIEEIKYMSSQLNIKCTFWQKDYSTTHKPNTDVTVLCHRHINPETRTVEVACVLLWLQVRDELCLLSQQSVPVQLCEKRMLLHLKHSTWWMGQKQHNLSQNTTGRIQLGERKGSEP